MRKNMLFVFFLFFAIGLCLYGNIHAMAKEYIVKPKTETQLQSVDNTLISPYIPELGIYITDEIPYTEASLYEFIEEDAPVELFDTYDYAEIGTQPAYSITGMEEVWNSGIYGEGIRIAVIDSGCNRHERLVNCLKEGASFVDGVSDTVDNIGHGTSVCGVIGAGYKDGSILGIARRSEIIPLKFVDYSESGRVVGGTTSRLAKAIVSAVDDFNCDIINMSCGTIDSNTLRLAVEYAASKGVIMTAAVGNDGSDTLYYPASYAAVIGVGAVDNDKQHASFSNTNESVYITAPGSDLMLLSGTSSTTKGGGTSFAAPYVSGIISDILAVRPEMNLDDVVRVIEDTAEDLGEDGRDAIYGCGLIRADNIINYLLKDCNCFTSNIDLCETDGMYEVRFRLNSQSMDIPTFILAEYTAGAVNQVITDCVERDKDVFAVRGDKIDKENGEFKIFVWKSLTGMIPF